MDTSTQKETRIIDFFKIYGIVVTTNIENIEEIKDAYISDEWVKNNKDYVYGFYHQFVDKNYDQMKMYYLKAIKGGHISSMNNLGFYYQNIEKNHDEMKRMYGIAISKGCVQSMDNLGFYYKKNEDYDLMKKLFELAIKKGNVSSMNNLGVYYEKIEKDYVKMKKYYEMAIEKGCTSSMNNLGFYYYKIEDYVKMKRLYEMGIEKGCADSILCLESYYIRNFVFDIDGLKFALKHKKKEIFDLMISRLYKDEIEIDDKLFDILKEVDTTVFHLPKVYKHLISSLSTHIDLLENHYKYQPKGYGFEDAKKEFMSTSLR